MPTLPPEHVEHVERVECIFNDVRLLPVLIDGLCCCAQPTKQFVVPTSSYSCDICRRGISHGCVAYGCRDCNIDVCHECHGTEYTVNEIKPRIGWPFAIDAFGSNNVEVIDWLIAHGLKPHKALLLWAVSRDRSFDPTVHGPVNMTAIMWLVENGVAQEGPGFVEDDILQYACCRAKSIELVEYLLTYPSVTFFDSATVDEAIDIAKSNDQPHFEGVIRDAIAQNGAVPPPEPVGVAGSPSPSDPVAAAVASVVAPAVAPDGTDDSSSDDESDVEDDV
jgi:hypothetical protein